MYLLNLSVLQGLFINQIAWSNYVHPSFLAEVLSYIVYWVLVLCSSILLYKYIELPAMKWRNKFKISVEMNR